MKSKVITTLDLNITYQLPEYGALNSFATAVHT